MANVERHGTSSRGSDVGAMLRRGRPREPVWFSTPYCGKTGAELAGYQWMWKVALVEDARGESRERRVSDWDEAVRNPETGREIVHQYFVQRPGEDGEWVSAESAAQLLGVSDGTARAAAKRLLADEIRRQERAARLEAAAVELDAGAWHASPAAAVEAVAGERLGRYWGERRRWGEAERIVARRFECADATDGDRWAAEELVRSCRDALWFTRGPKGWVALQEHEDAARGWDVVRLLARDIWDEHGRDRFAPAVASKARGAPGMG